MSTAIPSSLVLLLETPLAEELYQDWTNLVETVLITHIPPPSHLQLCMTIMVHANSSYDDALRSSCLRILLNTLAQHGSRAFKGVLDFDPEEIGRNKRRKIRQTESEAENLADAGELVDLELTSSESLCVVFGNLWDFFGCSFSRTGPRAVWWQHLSSFLCDLLQADWDGAQRGSMDLTKTLLVQLLRVKGERRVDLKHVLKCLLSDATLPETDRMLDPYVMMMQDKGIHVDVEGPAARTPDTQTMNCRRRMLAMLYMLARVSRLNVVLENEITSTLANLIAPLQVPFITSIFTYNQLKEDDFQRAIPYLCNALLFRLAAFPVKSGKAGERHVDWPKTQGWCASRCRSVDEFEIVKVAYFKYVLYMVYTTQMDRTLPTEEVQTAGNTIIEGLKEAERTIQQSMAKKRDDWQYAYLATPEELEDCLDKIKRYMKVTLAASANSSSRGE